MRLICLALAASIILSGCADPPRPATPAPRPNSYSFQVPTGMAGPAPVNYKAIVAAWARTSFVDPYSMRDVTITRPVEVTAEPGMFGWLVCLGANAKNRMGGYTGLKYHALLMRSESVVGHYPRSSSPTGNTGYDRLTAQQDALQGMLMLDLCAQAVQSGRTSSEPLPQLESLSR